jgi:hypothetical protein
VTLVPPTVTVPNPGAIETDTPEGFKDGNMQGLRSTVTAVLAEVDIVQLPGAGAPTEKFKVMGLLSPAALVALMPTGVLAEVVLGVPDITPVPVFKLTPVGRAPEVIAKPVSGGLVATMVTLLMAMPRESAVVEPEVGLVITGTALGVMVNVTALVPFTFPVFSAASVTVLTPLALGVPETTPVSAFRPRPAGKLPLKTEYPPVALIGPLVPSVVTVYCVAELPTVPEAVLALLIVGAAIALMRITTVSVPAPLALLTPKDTL